MSVDTYLKRKNLSRYQRAQHGGINILLANSLVSWAKSVEISERRFLLWKSLEIEVEPLQPHAHGPT